jgi:CRISP-associated protein Cas1
MPAVVELDLIPARALNQVTYCPRLYFLEYVEGVMPTNAHVEDGLFQHRRVNDPDLENKTRKDGDVLKTRSVSLSSEALGLTAKLDLLEESGRGVYPVEHKRGSAPRDEDGNATVWDNDAVQLCAQGLLLEEEFKTEVPHGVQYCAGSKERVTVPFDDALRTKTREAIALCRELSARESPPEPLPAEQRHKCHGCSLVTICQPEETLFQIRQPDAPSPTGVESPALQRVIPGTDDGAVVYLQEPGSYVGKRSEHLTVRKDNVEINRIPLAAVRQVVAVGNVQVSTQALETLTANGIPVIFMTGYGRFVAAVQPAPAKNVGLRVAQFKKFADPTESLTLAKAVVRAKLANQRTLLMRSLRGDGDRGSDEPAARDLAELLRRLDRVTEVESVLGLEGQGAALYFGEFARFLKSGPTPTGFDFKSRNRRPPRDPVNALLSFAYALLAKDCFAALCAVGFDPYYGFYHQIRHGKPALALDLMEEFRAVIADSVVLTLINNKLVTADDFLTYRDACQLTEAGRRAFFQAYETRKATVVTHPVYGYRMSYSRMLEVQARMLAAYVKGDVPTYTGFTVR